MGQGGRAWTPWLSVPPRAVVFSGALPSGLVRFWLCPAAGGLDVLVAEAWTAPACPRGLRGPSRSDLAGLRSVSAHGPRLGVPGLREDLGLLRLAVTSLRVPSSPSVWGLVFCLSASLSYCVLCPLYASSFLLSVSGVPPHAAARCLQAACSARVCAPRWAPARLPGPRCPHLCGSSGAHKPWRVPRAHVHVSTCALATNFSLFSEYLGLGSTSLAGGVFIGGRGAGRGVGSITAS